jgi:hypothetical protein
MSSLTSLNMTEKIEPEIGRTWRGGASGKYASVSILTIIPKSMTREYHLEEPRNVIFIPTEQGILIKKLEVKE